MIPSFSTIEIRSAQASDMRLLVHAAKKMFVDTFSEHYVGKPFFDEYVEEAYTLDKFQDDFQNPHHIFWIVWEEKKLAGFVQLVGHTLPTCIEAADGLEIKRFYIFQEYHGKGIAQRLMEKCIEKAASESYPVMWLGVWPENHRAIAFYRKFGFEICGDHPFILGSETEIDWVMKKDM
ncbi:MAG: GNAT family N-acetyltransferase [Bacteroidota bacterium]